MTKQEYTEKFDAKIKEIVSWFEDNNDAFTACIESLDAWNGFLGDDRFYLMEEINELYPNALDAMTRAYYGHDGECYSTDERGEKHYAEFCPNRDYFTFDGYGNFVSYDAPDYSDKIDSYAVNELYDNRSRVTEIEDYLDLSILFDELDEIYCDGWDE